jgi:4-amino-4-deoxy-L-arabinose transferase-like glycosyltransferase
VTLTFNTQSPRTWWLWLATLHLLLWTLLPTILHYNAPLDVAEAIAWGQQWQWGYDRDPYLVGWLAYSASWLTGHSIWGVYLLSQICVLATFSAIWRLAMQLYLSQAQALLSIFVLEGVFYYNFATPEFNDNVLQLPLWAFTISFFYTALTTQRTREWLLTGLCAGLALMAKYYTVMLFLPMVMIIFGTSQGRQSFKSRGVYLALLVAIIIIAPNIVWQYQHGFQYVGWALRRAVIGLSWHSHWSYPLRFLVGQAVVLIPCFILYAWGVRSFKEAKVPKTNFDRVFLHTVTWGPFITTLGYAAVTGTHMRSMWGMPLFSFVGLWLVYSLRPSVEALELRRSAYGALLSFFAALVVYAGTVILPPYVVGYAKTVSYPSVELAELVSQVWHQYSQQPLPYVAGSRDLAVRVAVYGKDHPSPLFDWNTQLSPWIDIGKMQQQGAIFVWDAEILGNQVPQEVLKAYPQVQAATIFELREHTKALLKPVRVGIAVLPGSSG